MALVTLTSFYSALQDWPALLLEAPAGTTILTNTATSFVFRYPASGATFPNYRVEVTGTAFAYDAGEPISGNMTRVRIFDGAGNLVVTIGNLGGHPVASDINQFYSNVFATINGEVGPRGITAWSHLMSGNDTINGTALLDDQNVVGYDAGNDVYNMGAGDDWIVGGMGNDTINGGDGFDTLAFNETVWDVGMAAFQGVTVNLQTGIVTDAWGGMDVVTSIEGVRGSRFGDLLIGSDTQRDQLMGLRGRDTIDGGANTYTSVGGPVDEDRRDEVRYDRDARQGGVRGIIVDLETSFNGVSITGQIRDGYGNLDTVRDIERVIGTKFNDSFIGSRVNNVFAGGAGLDSYNGMGGFDAVRFDRIIDDVAPSVGIRVNLSLASGQIQNDGYGNVENAIGIESIWGSGLNDSVRGGTGDEEMWLGHGRDTMTGGGGVDTFVWDGSFEIGQGDRVTDFAATGVGADHLGFEVAGFAGMTGTLTLVNGTAATAAVGTFVFNDANDTLYWDSDGTGAAAMVAVVVLPNVAALSAANFDLWV